MKLAAMQLVNLIFGSAACKAQTADGVPCPRGADYLVTVVGGAVVTMCKLHGETLQLVGIATQLEELLPTREEKT